MAISPSTGITTHGQRSGIAGAAVELASKVVLLDAFLFSLFLFDREFVAGVPLGSVLAVTIFFVGFMRKPTVQVPRLGMLGPALVVLFIYLIAVSEFQGLDWLDRALKLLALGLMMWTIVGRRIDPLSAVAGLSVAAIINTVAEYAGIAGGGGYLTGLWGEKNVTGLWYAAVFILGLIWIRKTSSRVLWLALGAVLLFLTGSRTSMSAFAAALLWILMRNRLSVFPRLLTAGALMWLLNYAEENLARTGVFEDRDGTDMLRSRIDEAVQIKVSNSPWHGHGLGEAWVYMQDKKWFFHDSYGALRVEGGWLLIIFWVALVVLVAGGLFSNQPVDYPTRVTEGAIVALLVCAWKLGEVFFTSIGIIVLALALTMRYAEPLREVLRRERSDG